MFSEDGLWGSVLAMLRVREYSFYHRIEPSGVETMRKIYFLEYHVRYTMVYSFFDKCVNTMTAMSPAKILPQLPLTKLPRDFCRGLLVQMIWSLNNFDDKKINSLYRYYGDRN